MSIIQAMVLGILQGFAEFLPISSSGHLLLLQNIFGIEDNLLTFSVILHIGTLIPVLVIYFDEIIGLIKNPFQKTTFLLILGTLPTVIVVLLFGDAVDNLFNYANFLALGFIVTGILLLITDYTENGQKKYKDITYKDALFVGLVQAVAVTPGISRSGSTIAGAVARGIDRKSAARFTFLMSIPAVLGAIVLELRAMITGATDVSTFDVVPMAVGFFASMISGYLAIKIMLKIIVISKLKYFSYYMFVVGVLIFLDQFFTNIVF